jgi:hypothetical protein
VQAKASKLDQTVTEEERSIKQVLLKAKKMEEEADKARAKARERKQKVITRVFLPCVGHSPVRRLSCERKQHAAQRLHTTAHCPHHPRAVGTFGASQRERSAVPPDALCVSGRRRLTRRA